MSENGGYRLPDIHFIQSNIRLPGGPTPREKARRAWKVLDLLLPDAQHLGDPEFVLILQCAQESLSRRWGPFGD